MSDVVKQPSFSEEHRSPEALSLEANGPYPWYRGVFFQATVVGFCAFTAPELWNAMQSVGAGGQQTPYLVMEALQVIKQFIRNSANTPQRAGNAILFALMAFTCLSGSIVINRIGLRYALAIGTTGYALYSAALYQNNRYGTQWFIYLGSAACGTTAGIFGLPKAQSC